MVPAALPRLSTSICRWGRDVVAGARPGYAKYTYPHPLRTDGGPTPTPLSTSTPTPTPAAGGQTYYVDQSAGSDSNNGTSPSTPWKNAPGMTAYTGSGVLNPGDTVYFDKADTWLVSGGTAPYNNGINVKAGVIYIGDEWGGSGSRATIRANSDLGAVIYFREDHPTYPTAVKGFNVDGNHKYCSGVGVYYPYYGYSLLTGAVKRIQNCDVHDIWSDTSLGQYAYGIMVSNHGDNNTRVENVEILNNIVHDMPRDGLCLYPGDEKLRVYCKKYHRQRKHSLWYRI